MSFFCSSLLLLQVTSHLGRGTSFSHSTEYSSTDTSFTNQNPCYILPRLLGRWVVKVEGPGQSQAKIAFGSSSRIYVLHLHLLGYGRVGYTRSEFGQFPHTELRCSCRISGFRCVTLVKLLAGKAHQQETAATYRMLCCLTVSDHMAQIQPSIYRPFIIGYFCRQMLLDEDLLGSRGRVAIAHLVDNSTCYCSTSSVIGLGRLVMGGPSLDRLTEMTS